MMHEAVISLLLSRLENVCNDGRTTEYNNT